MRQLSGLDESFLAMEGDGVHLHIGSVCVLDPSTAPEPLDLQRLTAHITARRHLVPVFRRRLLGVPFGLDQPYWIEDGEPDLEHHMRTTALPRPGDDQQLALAVARLHAEPLDLTRPLWELCLITGLAGGRVAVYSKVHHSAMDGLSGEDLLAAVLDASPRGRPVAAPPAAAMEDPPGTVSLLAHGAAALAARPARAARLAGDLLRRAPALTLAAADRTPVLEHLHPHDAAQPHVGFRAPHTPFNAPICAERAWAFADLSLTRVKRIKERAGVTVNDVVMALCAGALRRWLLAHDALPEGPLIAAVPVSTRTPADAGTFGNRLSAMLAAVPTDVDSPPGRLAAATAAMRAAKRERAAVPPTILSDLTALAPPALAVPGWQLSARLRLLERANPFNLFISNVAGPRVPLYYAGALLLAYYPISAIVHGQGLNITVMSYRDRLCFGLLACRELVPDLERLAAWIGEELHRLDDAGGTPARTAAGRGAVPALT